MTDSDPAKKRRKVLLIFPVSFYSFVDQIQMALSTAGYDVVIANHEYPMNVVGKILGNLRMFWLLSIITERVIYRNYISDRHYDLVLVFKGRGLSRRLIEKLRQAAPRIVAYNFDSFTYNPGPLRWYKDVDKYCTFDYVDSEKYSIRLVELYSSVPSDETPKRSIYDISAILRNHSNRLKYLDAVLNVLSGAKTFIYILELNKITFVFNFLRSPFLYIKYWSKIHFRPLPYDRYVSVLQNSNFTLDYAHPKQSGITIRCFEALNTGTKIITNNGFVRRSPFFTDRNTVIFDGKGSSQEARAQFESVKDSVVMKRQRSVLDFLQDLLA
jgi:hypothetical protein